MKHTLTFLFLILFLIGERSYGQGADILGATTPEQVKTEHRVFGIYTNRYQPDSVAIEFLHNVAQPIHIKVFFGTWCHDSKTQIPAFFKVMETVDNSNFHVEYVGVDKSKNDPQGLSKSMNLKYTPTFIIYTGDKEIGRIVEEPAETMEEDLVQILKTGVQ